MIIREKLESNELIVLSKHAAFSSHSHGRVKKKRSVLLEQNIKETEIEYFTQNLLEDLKIKPKFFWLLMEIILGQD